MMMMMMNNVMMMLLLMMMHLGATKCNILAIGRGAQWGFIIIR